MTIAWMLYVLLVGTLLACGALAVDGILRRTSLPTRWVWVVALAGIVGLAVLAPRSSAPVRARGIPVAIDRRAMRDVNAPATHGFEAKLKRARDAVRTSVNAALAAANARVPSSVATPLLLAWGVLTGALLFVIVVVNRRVRRDRRAWPVVRVCDTQVRIAQDAGPAVVGLARPEIVLPPTISEPSDGRNWCP